MKSEMLTPSLETHEVVNESEPTAGSQRDRAYQELRHILLLQQVREGDRLREPEWSGRLGVNRVALREAFARLEAEGFLEKGPKTGYFVPRLSAEDILEILEVRTALECAAVERICVNSEPESDYLAPLHQACDDLESLIRSGYFLGASEADRRFHETLVTIAGNRRLLKLFGNAPLPMLHGRMTNSATWEMECWNTLAEHRAITEALAARDMQRAQALLKEHLHGPYLNEILK